MAAAQAAAPHFERVTMIERDKLSPHATPPALRRGVPQGIQPHGILQRGRKELDSLFPGLMSELKAHGAFEFDGSYEMARLTPQGWAPRYRDIGASAFACSRPLLEVTMRRLLLAQRKNVSILEGVRVQEPIHHRNGDEIIVTGVRSDAEDPSLREIAADFVIDATGRGTKSYKWMSQVGLPEPEEQRIDAKCNYATRHYRAPDDAKNWWWKGVLIDSSPPECARAASILSVEGGRWIVTAIGTNGDYAPTDEQGWLAFIRSTRSPVVAELLARATPLTDVVQNRTTINIWHKMESFTGKLSGLLLLGDCVCCFNPSYGQGLTASALAAQTLGRMLESERGALDANFLRRYYRSQAKFLQEGWAYSTTLDLRWAKAEGKRPPFFRLQLWGANILEAIAIHDKEMMRKVMPLLDFGANRLSFFTPRFLLRGYIGLLRYIFARPRLPSPQEFSGPRELLLRDRHGTEAQAVVGTS